LIDVSIDACARATDGGRASRILRTARRESIERVGDAIETRRESIHPFINRR
jgi:hypothetical protein